MITIVTIVTAYFLILSQQMHIIQLFAGDVCQFQRLVHAVERQSPRGLRRKLLISLLGLKIINVCPLPKWPFGVGVIEIEELGLKKSIGYLIFNMIVLKLIPK